MYFEIDDPATLKLKQTCYEEQGIAARVRFIPGNYVADGVIDLLARSDFDFDLPTYVIWEGNTMDLSMSSVKHVLSRLRQSIRHLAVRSTTWPRT